MPRILSLALVASLAVAADAVRPGTVLIDGSTTVYPITVAVAEGFAAENPQIAVEVLVTGSSAGFRRLLAGEIPIANASRPINSDELAKAAKTGLDFVELPVAYDGITVVVNRANHFIDHFTIDELKRLWELDSTVKTWHQLRDAWPDQPIAVLAPGRDSGTFDFFSEAITGKARNQRSDANYQESVPERIQGVAANQAAISYMGFAYFRDNATMLRAVPIDAGQGPVMPAAPTILDGSYRPLARPLFIYVNKAALTRPEVVSFVDYYLRQAQRVVAQVGYVPLSDRLSASVRSRFAARTTGTVLPSPHDVHRLAGLLGEDAPDSAARPVPSATTASKPSASAGPAAKPVDPVIQPAPAKPALPPAMPITAMVAPAAPALPTVVSATPQPPPAVVPAPALAASATPANAILVPTPNRPGDDVFTTALTRMGMSSLAMARSALDAGATLDDLDRTCRRLVEDAQRLQAALPDRRLVEAATATGLDRWRTAALGLVQLRSGGADAAQLGDAARGAVESAQRDLLALIEAARTPPEVEAARSREAALARFDAACRRWRLEVTGTP